MAEKEEVIVIGIRRSQTTLTLAEMPAGTTYHPCSGCGEDMPLAPSGMTQVQLGARAVCLICAAKLDSPSSIGLAPGAREELAETLPNPKTRSEEI